MKKLSFQEALDQIIEEDPRYCEEAYLFVREALDHTIKMLKKPQTGPGRHVSGGELLDGIAEFAIREFGPMTHTVLKRWGINTTEDFGEIVFNLVEKGVLGKTDEDRREHFANGFDFTEVFVKPFLPRAKPTEEPEKNPKSPKKATGKQ